MWGSEALACECDLGIWISYLLALIHYDVVPRMVRPGVRVPSDSIISGYNNISSSAKYIFVIFFVVFLINCLVYPVLPGSFKPLIKTT